MTTILTVFLTALILFGLFYLFYRLKTPYYRVDKSRMIQVLEMVLTGQATHNDWQMTFSMTIRHSPVLEEFRQACIEVEEQHYIGEQKPPYLFSSEGLQELQIILRDLNATPT